ncbi:hypothetical protein QBC47DRAFT_383587 [Echria macrotheca]|uniref:Glutamyl-tRNA amidotransferase complex subunit Gta3 domain-containing protein n=1 Tax=Echria macrotheca TaxID=438768 RepID=A0AAJ0BC28_9PEZI|nr:hypothetical protein QBC47DRAFT_383587 [Echria macrotheca]
MMAAPIISSCAGCTRSSRLLSLSHRLSHLQQRRQSQLSPSAILSKPTWSVRSLLDSPSSSQDADTPKITSAQLHHLLRLSALPPPSSPVEEASMIKTLQSQLHFVRAIQQVDTTDVKPLSSIRDETAAGLEEMTIGLDQLKDALEAEEIRGHCRRPRRKRDVPVDTAGVEDWDALAGASEKAGKYFIVRSAKGMEDVS